MQIVPAPLRDGSVVTLKIAKSIDYAALRRFQGKGLGTVLLERLAAIAVTHGFRRFEATTLPENAAMLEVFRDSGFEICSKSQSTIDVQLSLSTTDRTVAAAERRIASATAASIRPLLEPAAVAVIGASREPTSIGRRILRALVSGGFRGGIYPINPKATELDGRRCYPSIVDAPSGIDVAIIAVPRALVLDVVDQCASAGVKSLVMITAGFAEAGNDGRQLQAQLVEKVRGYGLRMIGPNCMGVLNANDETNMNASFSPIVPPSGRVALYSQSGAHGIAILELASERRLGLSTSVSVGNKADVSGNDLLQYWEADPHTSSLAVRGRPAATPRHSRRAIPPSTRSFVNQA
jgi:predicted CoA-binding protein